MDLLILILSVCSFVSCQIGATRVNLNISKKDDLKLERQLNNLNKPAIKTIKISWEFLCSSNFGNRLVSNANIIACNIFADSCLIGGKSNVEAKTEYGDIFDCVDFFKQPAFDHPRLKNYKSSFQVIPPSILNTIRTQKSNEINEVGNLGLKALKCPAGTVPIQRVTKEDLIKETLASKARATENGQIEYAVVKTTGTSKYSGAAAFLSIHNPHVTGLQSSSARLRITNGPDDIQAGWRVDKFLHHGGNQTRFFIHTKAGETQCFNILCPGYVVVTRDLPPGGILSKISAPGGPIYEVGVFIIREEHGNWNLYIGPNRELIGYWPSRLFTGLSGVASSLEWGGEIYSPPNFTIPPMGSGGSYLKRSTNYDAFFRQVSAYNEAGQITDANDLEEATSSEHYHIYDSGVVDKDTFKHLVFYGGAGNT